MPALSPDRVPFRDIGVLLCERIGKDMSSAAIGDKIERFGRRGVKDGDDTRFPGIGDRTWRESGMLIGIVGIIGFKLRLQNSSSQRLSLRDWVDDRGVGIELHSDSQAIAVNASDGRALVRLGGLLFDNRRENHGLF